MKTLARISLSRYSRHLRNAAVAMAIATGAAACDDDSVTETPSFDRVQVTPATRSLVEGESHAFAAVVIDGGNRPVEGLPTAWNSSNPAVASVSANGTVTALANGTTEIRATIAGLTGASQLTVTRAAVDRVDISVTSLALTDLETRQLNAIPRDAAGRALLGRAITWTSDNHNVAIVSASGVVTAIGRGNAVIRAEIDGKSSSIVASVSAAVVDRVQLSAQNVSLDEGTSQTVTAVPYDASGRILIGRQASWTSSDVSVATVDGNGKITAVGVGISAIVVTIEGKTATVAATVRKAPVAVITVGPTALTLETGESIQLTAIVKDANGTVLTGRSVQWSTDNGNVAVSPSGLVTGARPGYVTIHATSEGKTGSSAATVILADGYEHDLVYHRAPSAGVAEIFTLALDGLGTPQKLNAGSVSRSPSPSPNGTRIAFAVSQEDLGTRARIDDIFAVDRTGLNMKQLTNAAGAEDQPAWSPIGGRIAYHSMVVGGRSDIWIMNEDGSGQTNLTAEMPALATRNSPAWSHDGQRIAFVQMENGAGGTTTTIWIMRADGSDKQQLSSTLTGFDSSPSWAPEGNDIAFVRYYNGDADITVINVNSRNTRRIALPGNQGAPAWAPDGYYIAFTQDLGLTTNIYTMRPDGSRVRLRTLDAAWGGGLKPQWIRKN
jgi:Tol biopolymer transport system component